METRPIARYAGAALHGGIEVQPRTIGILFLRDAIDDGGLINVRRKRQLYEDAVHQRVGIELTDSSNDFSGGRALREIPSKINGANLDHGLLFLANVGRAIGSVAYKDNREAGGPAACSNAGGYALLEF